MSDNPVCVLWIRQCLRTADNPALARAAETGLPVLPVYIWAPDEEAPWAPGSASRWWLHHSLTELSRQYQALGLPLLIRKAATAHEALTTLIPQTRIARVIYDLRWEPAALAQAQAVENHLTRENIACQGINTNYLFQPAAVRKSDNTPYKVFTPYWRACMQHIGRPPARLQPAGIKAPEGLPESLCVGDLNLLPRLSWADGFHNHWVPGETGAQERLQAFICQAVDRYAKERDRPDHDGVSKLSPFLHFGEVSVQDIRRALYQTQEGLSTGSREAFFRQLIWREFANQLLAHFPETPDQPLNDKFARFPWKSNPVHLKAWQRGETGYPIVDAGMHQLWQTGWMHNRVRMVAASLLTKHLLIPWQEGARWFWDTLVDADLANNTMGWQWVAGSGADAAPYYRIFNPTTQQQKFDPDEHYIQRWQGHTISSPIVDHAEARGLALAAYESVKTR
ncbi:MAG: deoxyribodipyrimidine photo-lyase [Candidatus Melainabacteria bacterium]